MRIVYIDIDSCRPDHLGCYGYHRNTSPAIDAIAREGIVFDKFYTSDAPCLPSRTALYSGRFGIQTGVVGHGGTAAQPKIEGPARGFRDQFDTQGLARQLQTLGLHTAMISPFGQRHAAWHFYAGFNEIHNTGEGGMESAQTVQPVVEDWLGKNASKDNWFLHINYWDPHTPYRVPEHIGNPFKDDPLPQWLEQDGIIERHNRVVGPHTSMEVEMFHGNGESGYPRYPSTIRNRDSLRMMIDGYDLGIRYVDDQIARISAYLKDAGIYEETAIIISADHGENQGELGIYGEHGTADEATCHVPFIIKWPGAVADTRNSRFHYNVDLAPTLMDLLGGTQQPLWDGSSFAKSITLGADQGRDELIISQCAHVCQRSVRWGKWLYIRTYHDGFRLFAQEMLFDIEADPHEQNDLCASQPDICREGLWRLARWHDSQMHKMALYANDVTDPLWTVMREGGPFHACLSNASADSDPTGGLRGFDAYLERLEHTGRAEGAQQLRTRHAAMITKFSKPR